MLPTQLTSIPARYPNHQDSLELVENSQRYGCCFCNTHKSTKDNYCICIDRRNVSNASGIPARNIKSVPNHQESLELVENSQRYGCCAVMPTKAHTTTIAYALITGMLPTLIDRRNASNATSIPVTNTYAIDVSCAFHHHHSGAPLQSLQQECLCTAAGMLLVQLM
jgi:hypothetical protein